MSSQDSLPSCLSQAPKRKVDIHRSPLSKSNLSAERQIKGNDIEPKEHPRLKRSIHLSIINCPYGETEA